MSPVQYIALLPSIHGSGSRKLPKLWLITNLEFRKRSWIQPWQEKEPGSLTRICQTAHETDYDMSPMQGIAHQPPISSLFNSITLIKGIVNSDQYDFEHILCGQGVIKR